jgi:hypothetical protein
MANGEWLNDDERRVANGKSPFSNRQSLPFLQSPVANRQFLLLPFFAPRPSSLAPFPSVVVKPFCWRP